MDRGDQVVQVATKEETIANQLRLGPLTGAALAAMLVLVLTSSASAFAAASRSTPGELLERYRPILRYDSSEEYFAQPVSRPLGLAEPRPGSRVYGHVAREQGEIWLQYWFFYANNPQDRGIFRTGRHEGDWELVQFRLGPGGKPDVATLAEHGWAEGCDWKGLDLVKVGGQRVPRLYVANASHATYSSPGVKDRQFPDPNDEADGLGRERRAKLVRIYDDRPAWVAWPGRWGGSRAAPIPGEMSSPRGPRFADGGAWDGPASFHEARARPCGSSPPVRWWQTPAIAGLAIAAVAAAWFRRRPT